jgi:hypothetical protein
MDCHCDIYVSNFNCHCFAILSYFICDRGGSQNRDYIKNQYIPRLTEEHMSLNRRIYGHVAGAWGGQYILRLRVTEEYIALYLVVSSVNRGM